MSNIVTLKSFPFDSMQVLNEQSGQMEEDRLYEAQVFREYFAKILSSGVVFSSYDGYGEDSMKVISAGGLNIKVLQGTGFILGADYNNEEDRIFTLERPATGNRVDRVVVKLDKTLAVRETQLYIKQGTANGAAELQRDDNIYEICLAEVLVKSTTNISQNDITDCRLNTQLCGIVNSLITVDGEELYQRFQDYIDSVTDSLVRKDQQTVVFEGVITDANGGTSQNDFSNTYRNKLDGIAEGATNVAVENNLTSTSTAHALSANQGRILKGMVDEKQKTITYGTTAPTGGVNGDIYLQYFD